MDKNENKWSIGNRMLGDTMLKNKTAIYYIFKFNDSII